MWNEHENALYVNFTYCLREEKRRRKRSQFGSSWILWHKEKTGKERDEIKRPINSRFGTLEKK
jgi:hypothetical protein